MADNETLRPAIDILMCHTGASFTEACAELGFSPEQLSPEGESQNED